MHNRQSPYHKRKAHLLFLARQRREREWPQRFLSVDHFMHTYEVAYEQYYGNKITVTYRHGWYYINNHPYRHSALQEMTETLLARIQEEEAPNPDKGE